MSLPAYPTYRDAMTEGFFAAAPYYKPSDPLNAKGPTAVVLAPSLLYFLPAIIFAVLDPEGDSQGRFSEPMHTRIESDQCSACVVRHRKLVYRKRMHRVNISMGRARRRCCSNIAANA